MVTAYYGLDNPFGSLATQDILFCFATGRKTNSEGSKLKTEPL